ncbi:patatin-like phospholipase family protein [Marasmitruncus massiliensis]|uniref:patatin-like phospholipase family protein n=1 Tax=Marasmitruncus massiliensis TaxID=1944642 RepID=UPI000C7C396D|nr:patatin-like phospholipase family protein [Marasmitruncus massiliensis]MBE6906802.1 phospholipase [Oscillospiraceae bacterium]
MSFGIALAGGGVRGAAHVGVLRALHENGLLPVSIAGTSAGSVVAGLYAAGVTPDEMVQLVKWLSKTGYLFVDPDYAGILKAVLQFLTNRPVTLSGLIKGNRLEKVFKKYTKSLAIQDSKLKTVIPAVDINRNRTVVFTNRIPLNKQSETILWQSDVLLSEAMRASIAVPTVFRPKQIGNLYLVDGGVTDVLPVNLLLAAGEANVLAVDISEQYKQLKNQNILEIASRSLSIMSSRLKECASEGEKLLLTPSLPDDIGLLSFGRMEECMEIGYETTVKVLPAIKSLFR